ncbi:iron-sulfur cluster assembly protein [Halanaeroarchaeum sulfurireducens]|uniref:MIP18 family-like domain-containing protein n=1 Tax=Halanaeroarchaeum sulfurireducens TaxID=1604004 RepID=A0A0F7P798_9EURY|nr:iron-sulfur cluster assembly protein [Halanaeroarchaeum sulfurireducens]AKH96572.1 hypothetical protein HLASF_0058 [Halanaeroarchaeum sulfurireducens]ALG80974.1 hypothetical protein HLASA_0058 [Halanaeroarchaeum sulfurireducens]
MNESLDETDVEEAIQNVTHPEIDATLYDLEMINSVSVENDDVEIDVAIPMMGIPPAVKQILRDRLATALEGLVDDPTIEFVQMSDQQRQRFFEMEEENWSGGLEGETSSDSSAPF